MALVANTDGYSQAIGVVEMQGSFDGADPSLDPPDHKGWFQWGYGTFGSETSKTTFPRDTESASFSNVVAVDKDRTIKFRAKALDENGEATGASSGSFRTFAASAVFNTGLTPGTPTSVTCPVSGSVTPNTNESNGTVTIEYRQQGTITWVQTGIIATVSGGSVVALTGTIYGLTPGTSYEARYRIDRSTENETIAYSNIGTFTTVGSLATIVGAVVMDMLIGRMMTPIMPTGVVVESVLPEDFVGQMMVPFISTTDRTRIVGALVSFNITIDRTVTVVIE